MNYPQRMYSKTELGLLYFPDTTDGATARRHIMVWIKRCEAGGIKEIGCVISPDNGSKVGLNQRSPAEGKGKAQKLLAQG